MTRQFAGFSSAFEQESFNQGGFDGLIVSSPDAMAAYYFTEAGFDTVDPDKTPDIREVIPAQDLKYATEDDLDTAAISVGISIYMSEDDQEKIFSNQAFKPLMRNFSTEPNELLEKAAVRQALENSGFDAFTGSVIVGIDGISATIFWKPDSFTLTDPVALIALDENDPSEVEIDFEALVATPSL